MSDQPIVYRPVYDPESMPLLHQYQQMLEPGTRAASPAPPPASGSPDAPSSTAGTGTKMGDADVQSMRLKHNIIF